MIMEMNDYTFSRMYQITINNPLEHGYTYQKINDILQDMSVYYFCMSTEIGGSGTEHIHIFVCFQGSERFSRVKQFFKTAHIEQSRGSAQDNIDYVKKSGKWRGSAKEETQVKETVFEYGEIPEWITANEKKPYTNNWWNNTETLNEILKGINTIIQLLNNLNSK